MRKAKISDAPGCFGSSVIRRTPHKVCAACQFRTVCGKAALVTGRELRAELNSRKVAV